MSQTIQTLDLRGLSCPLPIVKTAQAMKGLMQGDEIEVLATDPGSVADFPAWSRASGNTIVASTEEGGVYHFVVRKG